ncbi:conjugal transfer protein TraB [Streptomyces lydicus]|uniref:conjugal transfer protein TraB n=1 Tax=Streptomyces lydicus TaxID=47763 RepID=UPI00101116CE|nr:conjugal transfer protein TraB [Streptomyces lydicus]MCZ1012666.1 conjugal transfer protein TraB [Streptomyces lydicus]
MSSELAPRNTNAAPAPANGDNRYKAVQTKLARLGKALDDAAVDLEVLRRSMQGNANHTDGVATDVENADLDAKFVVLTTNVATALVGAARSVKVLKDTTQETADLTHKTRRAHAKLYGALDDIRSNRREKTPKAGFFNR